MTRIRKEKTPDDATTTLPVTPPSFLSELEKQRGDEAATFQALQVNPAEVRAHRKRDLGFRDEWDGIVNSFKPATQKRFIDAYARTHKTVLAAREAGIPRETLYRMRHQDYTFQIGWRHVEDEWERRLGRPGGSADRDTDADMEIIHRRHKGIALEDVTDIYWKLVGLRDERLPPSTLRSVGLPPTSVQSDHDEWMPEDAKRGGHGKAEPVTYSRAYLIDLVVYRYCPRPLRKVSGRRSTTRS